MGKFKQGTRASTCNVANIQKRCGGEEVHIPLYHKKKKEKKSGLGLQVVARSHRTANRERKKKMSGGFNK